MRLRRACRLRAIPNERKMAPPLAMTLGKALRRNGHSVAAFLQSLARALARRTEIRSPLCRTCDGYFRTCRAEPQRGSPAKEPHPEERRRQRARVEPVGAGTVATTSSALVRPAAEPRVPAGPETSNAAPSGARRQARGTERVISPAHLRWALRGIPAEVGVEETACGLGPGRSPPPTEPSIRFDGSAHNLSHPGAIAVQDIHFIPLS